MRAAEFDQPRAAGIILYAEDTGRWGLQQRADDINDGGLWAAWGGGQEPGETLEQCARRELAEESGYRGPITLEPLARNAKYVTFIGIVPHEFEPRPDPEWQDFAWVELGHWPQPLHPGVAAALQNIYIKEDVVLEYRNRLLQYVKSLLPTWPDYILKDWLVPNKGDFSNLPADALKTSVMEKIQGAGLTANTKWQLVPNQQFSMDMFEPMTKQRLIGRAGGKSDMGMGIPRDAERHATQAALAKQQGGVRKEPVILIKRPQGYELLEGWHRTIQHFAMYPDGYTGPAWIAVSSVNENFADGRKPGRKGLAKRMGVPTKASVSKLRSIAKHSTGEKARMAHWMANMKSGKKK